MAREDVIGRDGLILYQDGNESKTCFGRIVSFDDLFLEILTDANKLLISTRVIQKIKVKEETRNV